MGCVASRCARLLLASCRHISCQHPPNDKQIDRMPYTIKPTADFELHCGDAAEVLLGIDDASVDLIFTSPPYAERRKNSYGGVHADDYVEWFLTISEELLRVMKPSGSFILNIKEHAVNGERHTYVIELILALKQQGWLWTEEYMWHKKNSYPGKWPNRFRDSWERLLHFNKTRQFKMNQEDVMVPMGDWTGNRLVNLSATDRVRDESKVGSGFGKRIENWVGRDMAYPTNVLHMATECGNRSHSAAFPKPLPTWFIRLFTDPGDVVLDPFIGSGTTAFAAIELGRKAIGIEINSEYCNAIEVATQEPMQAVILDAGESFG